MLCAIVVTIGHETVMAKTTFFGCEQPPSSANTFDVSRSYLFQEQMLESAGKLTKVVLTSSSLSSLSSSSHTPSTSPSPSSPPPLLHLSHLPSSLFPFMCAKCPHCGAAPTFRPHPLHSHLLSSLQLCLVPRPNMLFLSLRSQ